MKRREVSASTDGRKLERVEKKIRTWPTVHHRPTLKHKQQHQQLLYNLRAERKGCTHPGTSSQLLSPLLVAGVQTPSGTPLPVLSLVLRMSFHPSTGLEEVYYVLDRFYRELSAVVVLVFLCVRVSSVEEVDGLTESGLVGGGEEVEGEEMLVRNVDEEVGEDVEEDDVSVSEEPVVLGRREKRGEGRNVTEVSSTPLSPPSHRPEDVWLCSVGDNNRMESALTKSEVLILITKAKQHLTNSSTKGPPTLAQA